ncbi:MAG TPA: PQQ-binding-like beta-propeller repeat protein [Vicinamibacterales bacterium]
MRRSVLAIVCALTLTAAVRAENWPQFRGVQGGVAPDDPALPDTWSATENVVWKLDVPGYSWSSPIVWGDHVFVTSAVNTGGELPLRPTSEYLGGTLGGKMTFRDITTPTTPVRWMLYDVDFKTGKIRWQQAVKESAPGESRHEKNSYASETPVTDGQRVYVYFSYAGLFAFDMSGKPVWAKPMTAHKTRTGWGSAASPVLAKDRVVIVSDNEEDSFIAAYSSANGNELWRIKRDEASNWASPFVWENAQRTEIITKGTKKIRSYSLDGTLLWELAGIATLDVPTPFAKNGLLYVESGYPTDQKKVTYAIRPGASGDITLKEGQTSNDFIVWSQQNLGTYATSTLVYGDYYYTLLDRGMLLCHDARTGKEIYGRQRVTLDTTGFTASPWAYNGKIFALSEDGDTFVMQAGPEFKVIGKNSLGELALATPAIANGSLIMRTAAHLYRIGRK